MIPFDSRNVILLGGTTAAVIAGVYVLWGPSEKKKPRRKEVCPGLQNLGNSCFLNSMLQALAPCMSVVQWLKCRMKLDQDINGDPKNLSMTLLHALEVLNNESVEHTDEYCPSEILEALRMRRWVITSDEQDAHELYHVLTETLEEETAKFHSVIPLFEIGKITDTAKTLFQTEREAQNRCKTKLPILPGRDSEQPFRGLLASQLQCASCAYKRPVKYDTFDSLSLSIPIRHRGVLTLEHLLRKYVTPETVQHVECEGCLKILKKSAPENKISQTPIDFMSKNSVPKTKTTFVKKLTIGKLPDCLCIHIQRTTWMQSGLPIKRFDHIAFPEILNMDNYVYNKKTIRPSSLDLDNRTGLVGGNKAMHDDGHGKNKKCLTPSPTVTVPYSGPVNLLKALNYTTRNTMNGFYIHKQVTNNKRFSVAESQVDNQVERLAQAYSQEMSGLADQNNSYKLSSVVVHLGDASSGHFITYRRIPTNNGQRFPDKWLYTSDTIVRKVSLAEVMQSDAYMLFYERV